MFTTYQCVTIKLKDKDNECVVSFVCGLHYIVDRRELWEILECVGGTITSPWLIMGDFRTIFNVSQRVNGNPISEMEMRDRVECIRKIGLTFLKCVGQFFSWYSGGVGTNRISSKIDCCLGNTD